MAGRAGPPLSAVAKLQHAGTFLVGPEVIWAAKPLSVASGEV